MGLGDTTLENLARTAAVCVGVAYPLYRGFVTGHTVGIGQPFPIEHIPAMGIAGVITGASSLAMKDKGGIMGMMTLPKPIVFGIGTGAGYIMEAVGFAAGYVVGKY